MLQYMLKTHCTSAFKIVSELDFSGSFRKATSYSDRIAKYGEDALV